MKNFEMTIAGTEIKWEEKSHAQIFRNFWAHFVELDVNKTLETIELVGIRTSEEDCFIAKNGQKKKNIMIQEDLYIYSHLTPAAMQKAYAKFIAAWEGEQPVIHVAPITQPKETIEIEPEVELSPQQKAAQTRKRNAEIKKKKIEELKAQRQTPEAEIVPQNLPDLTQADIDAVTL